MVSIKFIKKWHLLLVWPALIASVIYVTSAFTHPLMAWTGPQAKVMFAPSFELKHFEFNDIAKTLNKNHITTAKMAKLVPFQNGILLQITESPSTPRRYFTLDTHEELINHDKNQAIWLAQYYLKETLPIKNIELKTQFDTNYPSVNRLLPVYKIDFNTQDDLSVYIHTDTQALAGIENDWKRSLRFIFQTFHSFNWLDDYEAIRLFIISTLVGVLFVMSLTGLFFLVKLRRTSGVYDPRRRWHRRLSWFAVIPLLMFCLSGFFHLWQSSLAAPITGMQLTQSLSLSHWPNAANIKAFDNVSINQISLIQSNIHQNENLTNLYRLSVSPVQTKQDKMQNINTREKRFSGRKREKHALYIDANTGEELGDLDEALITQQAATLLNEKDILVLSKKMVTHFGLGYDFRNKRLPVWQVEGTNGEQVFIDPITHILVDKNNSSSRLEGYSFSFLHKWNMLTPIMGRFNRDVLILTTLAIILLLVSFGLFLHIIQSKNKLTKPISKNKADSNKLAA